MVVRRFFLYTLNYYIGGCRRAETSNIGERGILEADGRRYVIVGNGFAGTTAAEQLRKADAAASITMFADEPYPLYNRIALPPLLRKQVAESKVIIRDLAWHEKHAIDLRLSTRVEKIDTEGKTVLAGGREHPYDALL